MYYCCVCRKELSHEETRESEMCFTDEYYCLTHLLKISIVPKVIKDYNFNNEA
jgi:hypothetical protein